MAEDDNSVYASAQGLARCLRMLTEEAASLNLLKTFAALRDALVTCQSEMTAANDPSFETMPYGLGQDGMTLH